MTPTLSRSDCYWPIHATCPRVNLLRENRVWQDRESPNWYVRPMVVPTIVDDTIAFDQMSQAHDIPIYDARVQVSLDYPHSFPKEQHELLDLRDFLDHLEMVVESKMVELLEVFELFEVFEQLEVVVELFEMFEVVVELFEVVVELFEMVVEQKIVVMELCIERLGE